MLQPLGNLSRTALSSGKVLHSIVQNRKVSISQVIRQQLTHSMKCKTPAPNSDNEKNNIKTGLVAPLGSLTVSRAFIKARPSAAQGLMPAARGQWRRDAGMEGMCDVRCCCSYKACVGLTVELSWARGAFCLGGGVSYVCELGLLCDREHVEETGGATEHQNRV